MKVKIGNDIEKNFNTFVIFHYYKNYSDLFFKQKIQVDINILIDPEIKNIKMRSFFKFYHLYFDTKYYLFLMLHDLNQI